MDPKLLAIVTLRAAALSLDLAGRTRQADTLRLLAAGIEAGRNVDAHMSAVAAVLAESGGAVSTEQWDDVHARIAEDSARLHAP